MIQPRIIFLFTILTLVGFIQTNYPVSVPLQYVFMIGAMILVFLQKNSGLKVNFACIAFLAAGAISIMGNNIKEFFHPWQRFVLFAILILGCSPMFRSYGIDKVKRHLYIGGLWAVAVVAVLSFIGYFAGFGQYLGGFVNGYMGITGHPNFLGFYTMIAMVWVATLFFRCTTKQERIIMTGCWIACLITLLLCASRSALACGLAGTIMAVYLRFQKNATAMVNAVIIAVVLVILSLPYLLSYAETMMKKNMNFDNTDSMIADSRGVLWDLRYAEISESPIIGIGAYSCDTNLPYAHVFYNETTGSIELGSSYLGLLSQCGWLAFICLLFIAIPIFRKAIRYAFVERTPYAHLWLPILSTCFAHMIFEGYLMTAGAVQCIIVWMALGAADMCDTVADYPIAWEKEDPITPQQYAIWRDTYTINR